MAAGRNGLQKDRKVPGPQRIPLDQCAGVLLKVVGGPQHGTVAAGSTQAGQRRPEVGLPHLPQNPAPQL